MRPADFRRKTVSPGAPGAIAVSVGAALTLAVFVGLLGPWRGVSVNHLPDRILDLNVPPAEI